ncbi:MAG: hypothetical protein AAGE96_02130 [Cyanobacteria bacterium P01_G01_bin.19]
MLAETVETNTKGVKGQRRHTAADLVLEDTATRRMLAVSLWDEVSTCGEPNRLCLGHIAQGVTLVTGVELEPTASGLEIILKTITGSQR